MAGNDTLAQDKGDADYLNTQDLLDNLGGYSWFSILDQGSAYHQGFVDESSRHLTAFQRETEREIAVYSFNKSAGHHRHSHHQAPSVHVSNEFAPLSSTPTEIDTLVIGSSIVRHVNVGQPSATAKCIPGARAGDIEGHLKLIAKNKQRFRRIVIHCCFNDAHLKSSEVTKLNVASVCAFARTMSDEVVFSGPLPNVRNDEMFSRMSSFHRWLSGWCPNNLVGFVDNWKPFWGKPGLIRRDDIHPTREGAALLSSNIVKILASTH
ncbi:uncharacterized protein LOC142888930 [Nelusetta ayraudi]|uniref:uncharacterized protein LOC142888930 n=1 Tax=Nelusetta ayraudi TaxID=303726 RepID=UPI003F6F6685